jgi:prophage regulatory protein
MNDSTTNPGAILRLKQVCHRTGLSRSTLYLKMSQGDFPKPISLGVRSRGWLENEVAAWVQSRIELSKA